MADLSPPLREHDHETHVPTEQHEPPANSRVPKAKQYKGWQEGAQGPSSSGPLAPGRDRLREVTSAVLGAPVRGLPKGRRIRTRKEYLRIQEQGVRVQTRHFVFVLAKRAPEASPSLGARLGMVVSRKVGHAVARNRVKRLVREAFRAVGAIFGDGVDVVVIARSTRADFKLVDVVAEWAGAEERIKRLCARLALAR